MFDVRVACMPPVLPHTFLATIKLGSVLRTPLQQCRKNPLQAFPASEPLCSSVRKVGLICQWLQPGSDLVDSLDPSVACGSFLLLSIFCVPNLCSPLSALPLFSLFQVFIK